MKVKGVYEAHELTREHAYLGEHRNNLEGGYTTGGKIDRKHQGTSKTLDAASAGNVPKKGTNERY
jgi:hypothetical protein